VSNPVAHPFDLLLDIDQRGRERARASATEIVQTAALRGNLAVRLADQYLMLAMDEISEIIPLPAITSVPGVKPWLMGIANLRGTVISVVNLGQFLSGKASMPAAGSRVVVVKSGEWSYGLLIDEVVGMRHFPPEAQVAPAAVTKAALQPYVSAAYRGEGKTWLAFSIAALVADAVFADAAA
jgi:twitching motility protein PilI